MKRIVSTLLLTCVVGVSLNAGLLSYGTSKVSGGFKDKLIGAVKKEYVDHRKQQRALEGNNKSKLSKFEDKAVSTRDNVTSKGKEIVGQENINRYNKVAQYKNERVGQFKEKATNDAKEVFGESKVNKAIELKKLKDQKETELAEKTVQKSKQFFGKN